MPSWTTRYANKISSYAIMDMRRASSRVAFARQESFNNYSPTAEAFFEAFFFIQIVTLKILIDIPRHCSIV